MKTAFSLSLLLALFATKSLAFSSTASPSTCNTRETSLHSSTAVNYESLGDLNEHELLSKSSFAIPPNDLIARAKEIIFVTGIGLKDDAACLADNFTFRAAFVETDRDEFIQALSSFKLEESFDMKQQFFGWQVDPLQPNRVWFLNRQEAKHVNDFMGAKASGKELVLPPQTYHLDFDADGKVKEFGFYTVDRNQGNTGGLGGGTFVFCVF